eukprot:scaffold3396_cov385-Prasinococcus_capsulatus_cf.AAC.6
MYPVPATDTGVSPGRAAGVPISVRTHPNGRTEGSAGRSQEGERPMPQQIEAQSTGGGCRKHPLAVPQGLRFDMAICGPCCRAGESAETRGRGIAYSTPSALCANLREDACTISGLRSARQSRPF